ncbi:MAG: hypothetical protein ACK4LQ_00135 [Pararhodobacter sp.]
MPHLSLTRPAAIIAMVLMLVLSLAALPGQGGAPTGALLSAEPLAEATPRKPAPPSPQPDPPVDPQAAAVGGEGHALPRPSVAGCGRALLRIIPAALHSGLAHRPRAPPAPHA